jgi:hypothetical protein
MTNELSPLQSCVNKLFLPTRTQLLKSMKSGKLIKMYLEQVNYVYSKIEKLLTEELNLTKIALEAANQSEIDLLNIQFQESLDEISDNKNVITEILSTPPKCVDNGACNDLNKVPGTEALLLQNNMFIKDGAFSYQFNSNKNSVNATILTKELEVFLANRQTLDFISEEHILQIENKIGKIFSAIKDEHLYIELTINQFNDDFSNLNDQVACYEDIFVNPHSNSCFKDLFMKCTAIVQPAHDEF